MNARPFNSAAPGVRALRARWHLTAVIGAIAVASVFLGAAAAVAADLLETRNTSMSFDTPAPGHSVAWTMEADNLSDGPLEARLEVIDISGTATEGETPLTLSLELSDGTVLASGPARDLSGEAFPLAALPAGGGAEVLATVALPAAAGDAYRGSTARMQFDFIVTADVGASPGDLSETGASVWRTALGVSLAALAIGAGAALLLAKRRTSERGVK